jgi:hypothetical protein
MVKVPALVGLSKKVHPLAAGAGAFCFGYLAFSSVFNSLYNRNIQKIISSESTIPFWRNKNQVINIDRLYFSLDETKHNEPNILHDGL